VRILGKPRKPISIISWDGLSIPVMSVECKRVFSSTRLLLSSYGGYNRSFGMPSSRAVISMQVIKQSLHTTNIEELRGQSVRQGNRSVQP
jgi:hypothetical protein